MKKKKRIPEWIAISFSRGYSPPSDQTCVSCMECRFSTTESPGKPTITTSSYSNQNRMVWGRRPDRPMEQNWEPSNKLTHIWTINLQPKSRTYSERTVSSKSGIGQTKLPHPKEWTSLLSHTTQKDKLRMG